MRVLSHSLPQVSSASRPVPGPGESTLLWRSAWQLDGGHLGGLSLGTGVPRGWSVPHGGGCHRPELEKAVCDVKRGGGEEVMVAPAEGGAEQSPRSCGAGEEPGRAHDHGSICLWPGEEPAATQYPLQLSALVGPQGTDCTSGMDKGGWASAATKRRIARSLAQRAPGAHGVQEAPRRPSEDPGPGLLNSPSLN